MMDCNDLEKFLKAIIEALEEVKIDKGFESISNILSLWKSVIASG